MQIYYFTRSGRSKAIAEQLAQRYGTDARRIDDGKDWSGGLQYMLAAFQAVGGKQLPITYEAPAADDQIALVFPVWAGKFPPAVCTFLVKVGRERIICIPTSLGSTLTDRSGFAKIIDLVGKEITAPEVL